MPNVEGENPDFDDFALPGEGAFPEEPIDELAGISDELVAPPIEAEDMQPEPEIAKEVEPPAKEAVAEAAKVPGKVPNFVEWGCVIGLPVLLVLLALVNVVYLSTAVYVIAVGFIPYGIWKGRATNTVYTVILGCTLAAVLTAIYCLWLEVGRYQFDIKAREAKQRGSMSSLLDAQSLAHNEALRSSVVDRRFA